MKEHMLRPAVVTILLAALVSGQFDQCFPDSTRSTTSNARFDFSGVDTFGLNLLRELASNIGESNLLVSPYSIWSVLTLALVGAKGQTKTQLETGLGLPNNKLDAFRTKSALDFVLTHVSSGSDGGPELRHFNNAYFNKSLTLRSCVDRYLKNVDIIDFSDAASVDRINHDVSIATGGEIQNFLNKGALIHAVFVLLNAVYFKGTWKTKFNPKDTTQQPFYNSNAQSVGTVPMMTLQGQFNIVISPALDAVVLELPYDKSNISMLIILPNATSPSVEKVLQTLSPYTLEQVLSARKPIPAQIFYPKFDLKTELQDELIQALQKMGIVDLFDPSKSDLSDFADGPLYANKALHQAKVRVDEIGTVASAATAIIGTRSGPAQAYQFIVNRPFIFLIYELRTKTTLFAGVVNNPSL